MKKRLIAGLLSLAMLGTTCGVSYASPDPTIGAIPLEKLDGVDIDGGISFTGDGTVVEEGYNYSFTVKRTGDLSEGATVTLASVDIASQYGEDYTIYVPNAKTKVFDTNGTLIEQAADDKLQGELIEAANEVLEEGAKTVEENTGSTFDELVDDTVETFELEKPTELGGEVEATQPPHTSAEVSSLAALKEEQTGLPTRVTNLTASNNNIVDSFVSSASLTAEMLNHSSQTELTFEPDQEEVTVYLSTKKDGKSEGDEIFQLYLISASEPFVVGGTGSMQITIMDSDPVVTPLISFDKDEYTADEDKVTIKLIRSEASYAICSTKIQSYEVGSAVTGTDFGYVDSEVTFTPFNDEFTLDIPVTQSSVEQYFELGLYDAMGADYGENQRVKVTIPARKSKKFITDTVADTTSAQSQITIGGTTYKVSDGYIIDNYNNRIGQWFRTDNSVSTDHNRTGEVPNSHEHKVEQDKFYMYWNSYRDKNKGKVWVKGMYDNVPTNSFDNFYVKWQGNSVDGPINANAEFWFDGGSSTSAQVEKKGNFDETYRVSACSLTSKDTAKLNAQFSISRGGWNKMALSVYGFAAMYHEFHFSIDDPDKLEFRNADGTYRKEYPAKSSLGVGQEKRFFGQTLSVVNEKNTDGHYYGKLTGYKLTIKDPDAKDVGTLNYPLAEGKTGIELNAEFAQKVKSIIGSSFTGHFSDYNILVKPIFDYVNVKLNVTKPIAGPGYFNDAALKVGDYTYHRGDAISMAATSADVSFVVNGYVLRTRINAEDTKTIESTVYNNDELVLENEYYSVCPSLTDNLNCIRVRLTTNAEDKVKVLNTIPQSALKSELRTGGFVINTNEGTATGDVEYEYIPVGSKVYTIQVVPIVSAPEGKAYKIKFTRNGDNSVVSGCAYDMIASNITEANVITVDVETVDASSLKNFSISGTVSTSGKSIRESEITYKDEPVSGMMVLAGGMANTVGGKTIVSRASGISDKNGLYATSSVVAQDGDYISVRTYSDTLDQVSYVKVYSASANTKTIQDTITNKDVQGFDQGAGVTIMPIRTATAPYVTHVGYDIENQGDYSNTVKIVDAQFRVFADVATNGRTVEKAIFTIVHKTGTTQEFEAKPLADDKNRFSAEMGNLSKTFADGDKLYVSLVDSQKKVYSTISVDSTGKEVTNRVQEPIVYQRVFTGLTFYLPALAIPQKEFNGEINDMKVDIPVLGSTIPKYKSGEGSFEKVDLSNGQYSSYCYRFVAAGGNYEKNKKSGLDGWKKYNESLRTKMNDYNTNARDTKNNFARDHANEIMGGVSKAEYARQNPHMNQNEIDQAYERDTEALYKKTAKKDSASENFSKVEWSFTVAVMVDVYFVYVTDDNKPGIEDKVDGSFRYAGCAFGVAADGNVQKTFYTVFYGVPVYIAIGGKVQFAITFGGFQGNLSTGISDKDFRGMTNLNRLANGFVYLNSLFALNISPGVGLCGVVGVRGNFSISLSPSRVWDSGATTPQYEGATADVQSWAMGLELAGGITIDLVITSIDIPLATGTWKYGNKQLNTLGAAEPGDDLTINDYVIGTSDLSTFGSGARQTTPNGIGVIEDLGAPVSNYTVLLNETSEYTRAQTVSYANGEIGVFFMGGYKDGNTVKNKLYYSERDLTGKWSTPTLVNNNGDEDSTPRVILVGEKCLVSWVDVPMLSDGFLDVTNKLAVTKERMADGDIKYCEYDHASKSFGQIQLLEDDAYLNTNPVFGYDNDGLHYAFYEKRDVKQANSTAELADVNATYQTLVYRKYADGVWGDEQLLHIPNDKVNDPLINDFDATYVEVEGKHFALLTYSVDESGSVGDSDQNRNVYIMPFDLDADKAFYPIPLSKAEGSDVLPQFVRFNGELLISWLHDAHAIQISNLSKLLGDFEYIDPSKTILTTMIANAEAGNEDWYIVPNSAMDEEEYNHCVLGQLANGTLISDCEELYYNDNPEQKANLSSYKFYNYNDEQLYLVWTDDVDGDGKEVYSSVYELYNNNTDGLTALDECAIQDWSCPVQVTSCDKELDEPAIAFDREGGIITFATTYDVTNDDGNSQVRSNYQFVVFEFKFAKELSFDTDNFVFTTYPISGCNNNFSFTVKNEGLRRYDKYTFKVYYDDNLSNMVEVCSINEENGPIAAGAAKTFNVDWLVPEDYIPEHIVVSFTPWNDGIEGETPIYETHSLTIPQGAKLKLDDLYADVEQNNVVLLNGILYNEGNKASSNLKLNVYHHNATDVARNELESYYSTAIVNTSISPIDANSSIDIDDIYIPLDGSDFSDIGIAELDVEIIDEAGITIRSNVLVSTNELYEVKLNTEGTVNLKQNDTLQLETALYPPNALDKTLIYESTDPSVVNVSADGVVTAIGEGSAEVFVYSPYTYVYDTVTVNVPSNKHSGGKGLSGGGGGSTANTNTNTVNIDDWLRWLMKPFTISDTEARLIELRNAYNKMHK